MKFPISGKKKPSVSSQSDFHCIIVKPSCNCKMSVTVWGALGPWMLLVKLDACLMIASGEGSLLEEVTWGPVHHTPATSLTPHYCQLRHASFASLCPFSLPSESDSLSSCTCSSCFRRLPVLSFPLLFHHGAVWVAENHGPTKVWVAGAAWSQNCSWEGRAAVFGETQGQPGRNSHLPRSWKLIAWLSSYHLEKSSNCLNSGVGGCRKDGGQLSSSVVLCSLLISGPFLWLNLLVSPKKVIS